MKHLTFKEHLLLSEERKEGVKYTEKQVKNVVDRVTATLAGSDAANMTKLANRFAQIDNRLKVLKEKHSELNDKIKGDVGDYFNAEDAVLTRVAETAQFTLTLAKEIKKADGQEVDYNSIIAALSALVSAELQPRIDEIIQKYTKVIPAGEPIKKLSVKRKLEEGVLDKLKELGAKFLKSIMSWAGKYDTKLDALKRKAGVQ